MEEQIVNPLEKALGSIIEKGVAGVEKGVSFLEAQLPDVIEQLLTWKMWELILWDIFILIGCAACIGGAVLSNKKHKAAKEAVKNKDRYSYYDDWVIFGVSGFAIIGMVLCAGFIAQTIQVLKIWIAPKIYLIEYAAELIK